MDAAEPIAEALVARAAAAEEAALAVPGVTNSEGAEAGFGRTEAFLVTSAGFAGSACAHQPFGLRHRAGRHRHGMQRDYDYHIDGASRRPGRPGGDRPQRRRAGGRAAEPDAAEDGEAAGGLRSARRGQPAGPSGRRDQRRLGGARHQLS